MVASDVYILVTDCETTGLGAHDEVIEVALAIYSMEHKTPIWCYSSLVPSQIPENRMDYGQHVHGITKEMLRSVQQVDDGSLARGAVSRVVESRLAWCVAAHNVEFDRRALESWLGTDFAVPWYDTQQMTWRYPDGAKVIGKKLSTICRSLEIPAANHHRALGDVLMLCEALSTQDLTKEFGIGSQRSLL